MFIAYIKQKGEGCDYTIGCAQTILRLSAQTRYEAIEELRQKVIGEWLPQEYRYPYYENGFWGERELDNVILFEISRETEIPLDTWYTHAIARADTQKGKEAEGAERLEFERLRTKFEG